MNKKNWIAVIYTHNISETMAWLVDELKADKTDTVISINYAHGKAETDQGVYILINSMEKAYGFEFNDVWVSPFYINLPDLVRLRITNGYK